MTPADIVIAVPLLSVLAAATLTDLTHRRIFNGLSLGGALVGLATQATLSGPHGVLLGLTGWIVCLLCFMPLYMSGGVAAGDVKLMAAVGAFVGPVDGFAACLCTLIAGAIISSLYLGWHYAAEIADRFVRPQMAVAANGDASARPRLDAKIPYAGAIALGATAVVLRLPWLETLLSNVVPS